MGHLLSKMIEQWPGSSNTFLVGVKIDRSTFYKVKTKKRKPTEAQFCSIVHRLNPEEDIKRQLIEEFEMERLWKPAQEKLLIIVREFLHYLNSENAFHSNGMQRIDNPLKGDPIPEALLEKVKEDFRSGDPGRIQMRISPTILDKYDWNSLFPVLDTAQSVLQVDIVLSNSREENYDVIRKLRHTELYFSFMKTGKVNITVYREKFFKNEGSELEEPYPFYVIGKNQMFLIQQDLEEWELVRKESVIRNYQSSLEARLPHSYTLMEPYDDIETMQKMLIQHFRDYSEKKMDIFTLSGKVSWLPGMTDEMIQKFFRKELADWLCEIRSYYNKTNTYEYYSEREYYESLERNLVSEWGMSAQLEDPMKTVVKEGLEQRRKDRKIILISDGYGYHPDQATLHLFGGKEMFLMLWKHEKVLIRIRERELIEGMHQWFRNRAIIQTIEERIESGE